MEHINCKEFFEELKAILSASVGKHYALEIACNDEFMSFVYRDVEETSAWKDEGYYTDDDIRLAIGRAIMDRFDIPY